MHERWAVRATHQLAVLCDEGPVLVLDACGLRVREGDVIKDGPVKDGVSPLGGQQGLQQYPSALRNPIHMKALIGGRQD